MMDARCSAVVIGINSDDDLVADDNGSGTDDADDDDEGGDAVESCGGVHTVMSPNPMIVLFSSLSSLEGGIAVVEAVPTVATLVVDDE